MKDYIQQNKESWEFNVYDFWVKNAGTPEERAAKDIEDPIKIMQHILIPMKVSESPTSAAPAVKRRFRWLFSVQRLPSSIFPRKTGSMPWKLRQPHILPLILLWEMYWKSTWTGTAANLTWYSWKAESSTFSMISVNLWMSCIPCSVPADA